MNRYTVPRATLGRLPRYLELLRSLPRGDYPTISATAIAARLSLGEVQVRKDLSAVSGVGKPRLGYVTADLITTLEHTLGCHCITEAVLIGAGRLGRALLQYDEFEVYGVKITAAFDVDPSALSPVGDTPVYDVASLPNYCRAHSIRLGIITVGESAAQTVADIMTDAGITAIWNFAPCSLHVPEGILLRQENLALSLAHLSSQLRQGEVEI